jgi:hypothetical protein
MPRNFPATVNTVIIFLKTSFILEKKYDSNLNATFFSWKVKPVIQKKIRRDYYNKKLFIISWENMNKKAQTLEKIGRMCHNADVFGFSI